MFRSIKPGGAPGLLTLALLCSTAASAQTTALPDVVISANQTPQEADRVGASATVLRGEELRARGIETLADALREVPGVVVTQAGSKGSFTQVRIRGGDANHLLVQIDDVPVNRLDSGDFDFADFLIDDVERIEVVRGPQSGLYGGNAHSGVISIYTKSGRGLKHPELVFRTEGGTQRSHFLSGTLRGASGPFYGAVTFQHRETDGFNISRFGNEKDGHRAFVFTGRFGVDISDTLNIEGVIRHTDRTVQYDPENAVPIPDGNGLDTFRSTLVRVNVNLKTMDGALVHRFGTYGLQQDYTSFNGLFGPPAFATVGETAGTDYKGTWKYNLASLAHTSTIVVDHVDEKYRHNFGADFQRARTGIAYEHILDLPTGLTVSGAARQDFHDTFSDFFTWRIAASQKLPLGFRLHSNIGRGVTLPTFFEQFSTSGTFRPNPDLQPESSIGWDFGIERTWWNGLLVTDATYFSSRFDNRIVVVAVPGGTSVTNIPGISTRHGVELSATLNPVTWLTLQGSFTYSEAENPDGIEEIRRPRNSASFAATFRLPDQRTKASVTVNHNGKRADDAFIGFPATRVTLASYTLVNAIVSYDLTPFAQIYIRGENLLDERYEEVFSYRSPGATGYVGLRMKLGDITPAVPAMP